MSQSLKRLVISNSPISPHGFSKCGPGPAATALPENLLALQFPEPDTQVEPQPFSVYQGLQVLLAHRTHGVNYTNVLLDTNTPLQKKRKNRVGIPTLSNLGSANEPLRALGIIFLCIHMSVCERRGPPVALDFSGAPVTRKASRAGT